MNNLLKAKERLLKKKRNAFTIVELVIVIAVIGVLAAILIPTFISLVDKANSASDQAAAKNMNTALKVAEADNKKPATMYDALEVIAESGYNVEKLTPSSKGYSYYWDQTDNQILYCKPDGTVAYPSGASAAKWESWAIIHSNTELATYKTSGYSLYLADSFTDYDAATSFVDLTAGLDVGNHGDITTISYIHPSSTQSIILRTNGGNITINAPADTVKHYGMAETLTITSVASESYHEYGSINFIDVYDGHVVIESEADVKAIYVNTSDVSIKVEAAAVVDTVAVATGVSVNVVSVPRTVTVEENADKEEVQTAATLFAGGRGTENNPFIIRTRKQLANVSLNYETYAYYEVADDIESIDLSGWVPLYLHGSFNGHGVKFTNVTACLFNTVGYKLSNETVVLQDFEATMNVSANGQYGAVSLIKNLFNSGTTTFKKVQVHGYLEGYWNIGSFFNYGTANYDDVGCNYTVKFENCKSDATLVCASGNTCGGFLGNSYEGRGHSFNMYVDSTSKYTGTIYTTTGSGYAYFAMTTDYYNANNHFYIDGVEETNKVGYLNAFNTYATHRETITSVIPVLGESSYTVAKQAGTTKIFVSITAQLTAYDAENVVISNLNGITFVISGEEIASLSGDTISVFSTFTSAEIVNGSSHETHYAIEDGVLKVYTGSDSNYLTGPIRLQVNQYNSGNGLIACGTLTIATLSL